MLDVDGALVDVADYLDVGRRFNELDSFECSFGDETCSLDTRKRKRRVEGSQNQNREQRTTIDLLDRK